jgi:hypothetical protein
MDFAAVSFVCAATINMLVAARDALGAQGGSFMVRSPTSCLLWMLDLFGLADMVEDDGPGGVAGSSADRPVESVGVVYDDHHISRCCLVLHGLG